MMTIDWLPPLDQADPPLYMAIARALALDVAAGRLRAGDRLPPQRELADALGVALGTVTRAYAEAERRGLVRGLGRRGTLVSGENADVSGLRALSEAGGLVDLLANHPTASLDPDLRGALKKVAGHPDAGRLLAYPPPEGLPEHRELAAGWLRDQGVAATSESVVMTAGAQHGMTAALSAVARPGDGIACDALTYPGVKASAAVLGLRLVPIAGDADGMLPETFEKACRRRGVRALYTIPSVHNPTSVTLSLERRRAIARSAAKHDVVIVEDEIHRPLLDSPAPGFATLVPDRTILVSSPSKSVVGGLRVGVAHAPRVLLDGVVRFVQASQIGPAPLGAAVFAQWIADGTVGRVVRARRKESRARQALARRALRASEAVLHGGADSPYLWVALPERWSAERFAREARELGVAVAPADLFAVDTRRVPRGLRLALSGPSSRDELQRGLEVLAALLAGEQATATASAAAAL